MRKTLILDVKYCCNIIYNIKSIIAQPINKVKKHGNNGKKRKKKTWKRKKISVGNWNSLAVYSPQSLIRKYFYALKFSLIVRLLTVDCGL
jgi:hypothetical protein